MSTLARAVPVAFRADLGEGHRPVLGRADLGWLAGLASVGIGLYVAVVTATYGFTDDYHNLLSATTNDTAILRVGASGGRPLSALVQEVAFSLATDVGSLRWVRLVGVVGVVVAAASVYVAGRVAGLGPAPAALAGAVVLAAPSSQVIGAWAIMFPASWAVAAAVVAGIVAAGRRADRPWSGAVPGVVLLVGALAVYQPSAMAFWAGVVLGSARGEQVLRRVGAVFLRSGVVLAGALVVHVVMFRVLAWLFATDSQARAAVATDPLTKVRWFAGDVLPLALVPTDLTPSRWVAAGVLALLAAGLYLRAAPQAPPQRAALVVLQLLVLPASYLANLVIEENWASARTRVALDVAVVALAVLACQGWASTLPASARRWAAALPWAVATALVATAAWRVNAYFAAPQHAEYLAARSAVHRTEIRPEDTLVLVRARLDDSTAPAIAFDEFGLPSTFQPWVPRPLVLLELLHAGRPWPRSVSVVSPDAEGGDIPTGTVRIDFDEVLDALVGR